MMNEEGVEPAGPVERPSLTVARFRLSRMKIENDLKAVLQQAVEISSQALNVARVGVEEREVQFLLKEDGDLVFSDPLNQAQISVSNLRAGVHPRRRHSQIDTRTHEYIERVERIERMVD